MDVYKAVADQVLQQAKAMGLLQEDELIMIPEVVGLLTDVTTEMAEDIVQFHLHQGINLQPPIWQRALWYAWTKGVESVYLFQQTPAEPPSINYRPEDVFQGLVGAQVPRWLQAYINKMAPTVIGILPAMLPWVSENLSDIVNAEDGLKTCLQSSLFHAALVGVSCGHQRLNAGSRAANDEVF